MNDSRCRQHTAAYACLLVATLGLTPSCGSGAAPSSESTQRAAQGKVGVEGAPTRTHIGATGPARAEDDDNAASATSPAQPGATPFLCMRDPAAFDLSQLTVIDPSPAGFGQAWIHAKYEADVPGFVVVYTGTMTGPNVHATVGTVYQPRHDTWEFMTALPRSEEGYAAPRDPADPFFVKSIHSNKKFITAFGQLRKREGFIISEITVEGHLDGACRRLKNVVVTMVLPKDNLTQVFGGRVLGEVMGPMTTDTDNDGVPDAWTVTAVGASLSPLNFAL